MKKGSFIVMALTAMLTLAACGTAAPATSEAVSGAAEAVSEVANEVSEATSEMAEATSQAPTEEKTLRLTTTTSVNDSGLMDYLREPLKKATGLDMEIVSKGSGAAIEDGQKGNADVILVHSPAAEEKFVSEGYGVERNSFMHNFFVIVGPAEDPAGIKGKSAEEALKAIADTKSLFVSRGDESGTHTKEKSLWEGAGVDLAALEQSENYNSLGDGMGATLTFASEQGGYTLTDLSTFLSMKNDLKLEVLVDSSDSLKNVYSIIVVNPDKVSGTDVDAANAFKDWMLGEEASKLIEQYGVEEYGKALFFLGK